MAVLHFRPNAGSPYYLEIPRHITAGFERFRRSLERIPQLAREAPDFLIDVIEIHPPEHFTPSFFLRFRKPLALSKATAARIRTAYLQTMRSTGYVKAHTAPQVNNKTTTNFPVNEQYPKHKHALAVNV